MPDTRFQISDFRSSPPAFAGEIPRGTRGRGGKPSRTTYVCRLPRALGHRFASRSGLMIARPASRSRMLMIRRPGWMAGRIVPTSSPRDFHSSERVSRGISLVMATPNRDAWRTGDSITSITGPALKNTAGRSLTFIRRRGSRPARENRPTALSRSGTRTTMWSILIMSTGSLTDGSNTWIDRAGAGPVQAHFGSPVSSVMPPRLGEIGQPRAVQSMGSWRPAIEVIP